MRLLWPATLLLLFCLTLGLQGQDQPLTATSLPRVLGDYQQTLQQVDAAFTEILSEKMPLLDDSGRPVGRHNIEDRHKEVAAMREIAKQLTASPQDLVVTLRLADGTEKLGDDVYDLSQMAFNSDREELANRLARLLPAVDLVQDALGSYAVSLADGKQKRIVELELEVQELRQKLDAASEKLKQPQHPQ